VKVVDVGVEDSGVLVAAGTEQRAIAPVAPRQ
jgi:hypothetical protein